MAEHTPTQVKTPWHQGERKWDVYDANHRFVAMARILSAYEGGAQTADNTAAFIVKTANLHDRLVAWVVDEIKWLSHRLDSIRCDCMPGHCLCDYGTFETRIAELAALLKEARE